MLLPRRTTRRRWPFRRVTALFLLPVFLILPLACGDDAAPNRPPTITVTTDPIVSGTVESSARFAWSASDPDGYIARFEYAVDPPPEFTLQEISEGGPGVVTKVLPGDDENPGVTRVSKTVGGETVSFDWIHTEESSKRFAFSAPDSDTVIVDTTGAAARFSGMHTLYLRAVDDDGAVSEPYHRAFTATTFAPTSRITYPPNTEWIVGSGQVIRIDWTGRDPDGASDQPASYLFKLVDITDRISIIHAEPEDAFEDQSWWIPVSQGPVDFNLEIGHQYMFVVRAVDEAGAVEPFAEWGRNAFRIQAFASALPTLTIKPPRVGNHAWPGSPYVFRGGWPYIGSSDPAIHVPVNTDIFFSWSATVKENGGIIWGYSWGLDIVDMEREGTDSGWGPWGDFTHNHVPLRFSRGGTHTFHVRVRDAGGGTTYGEIKIRVADFPFDRDLLLVDDSFDFQFPTDSEQDVFWREQFESYGISYSEFSAHEVNDRGALSPLVPDLDFLGRYKTVLWVNHGGGYNAESALLKAASLSARLPSYLLAGGSLWVQGRMTIPPMLESPNDLQADLVYPIDEERLQPGTFAWDFMKLQSPRVLNAKGRDPDDGFYGVAPYPGQPAIYDSMTLDLGTIRYPFQTSVTHCEALEEPLASDYNPDLRGVLEKLYTYRAYGPEMEGTESDLHGKLNALRWHDPDPDPVHGRTQWFGFSLYFMDRTEAQETLNRSLDWFREGSP